MTFSRFIKVIGTNPSPGGLKHLGVYKQPLGDSYFKICCCNSVFIYPFIKPILVLLRQDLIWPRPPTQYVSKHDFKVLSFLPLDSEAHTTMDLFHAVLWLEPRALCLLGKRYTGCTISSVFSSVLHTWAPSVAQTGPTLMICLPQFLQYLDYKYDAPCPTTRSFPLH